MRDVSNNVVPDTVGVILAGGSGLRFGSDLPKQYHNLAGKMIAEYALETFLNHPRISEVIFVHGAGYDEQISLLQKKFSGSKPLIFTLGGGTRAGSSRAALTAIPQVARVRNNILFHDAVRPFVSDAIIDRCLAALNICEAVDTVVPAIDTIVELDTSHEVLKAIPSRAKMRRGQTPQGFRLSRISEAYSTLDDDQLSRFTDDCGVLLSRFPDVPVAAVDGHENNIKITSPLDMFLAEQLMYMGYNVSGNNPKRVNEKTVAVLFGGTSGLGLCTAEQLADLGWTVEVASRSTGVDVRDMKAVKQFLDRIEAQHGRIDLVANFAGILQVGRLQDMDMAKIDEVLSVNLMGSIVVSQCCLPYLSKTSGHLVLTSSSSYYRGRADTAAYSASKAAVVNLTQALADEWAEQGVTVSCVVPRRADTPMRRRAFPDEDQLLNLKPRAVADAIVELHQRNQTGIVKHVY